MGKRGQFFSIDVFVAVAIIGVGMVILFTTKVPQSSAAQTAAFSSDLMNSLSTIKVTEINNDLVFGLLQNGSITNRDNTVLEQIGEYYSYGQIDLARNITANVTDNALPVQYDFALYIEDSLFYSSRPFDPRSPNLVSNKRLIAGVRNASQFWGPLKVEVRVWR